MAVSCCFVAGLLVASFQEAHLLGAAVPVAGGTGRRVPDAGPAGIADHQVHAGGARLTRGQSSIGSSPDAGTSPVTEDNLTGRHRIWMDSVGPLLRGDGTEYDKSLISPYS